MIAAYVSGHGFGHATRTSEVLRAVRARAPELPIAIVTQAPEGLFRTALPGPFTYRGVATDTGLAQQGALTIDEEGTVTAWRAFMADQPARVAREAEWLTGAGCRLVLGDIPPSRSTPRPRRASRAWPWATSPGTGSTATSRPASRRSTRPPTRRLVVFPCSIAPAAPFRRGPVGLRGARDPAPRGPKASLLARNRTKPPWFRGFGRLVVFRRAGTRRLLSPAILARLAPRTVVVSEPGDLPPNVRCIPNSELESHGRATTTCWPARMPS